MRQISLVVLIAPLFLASAVIARPNYAPETIERSFLLEWTVQPGPKGPTVEGYVHNKTDVTADRMRIAIEQLDAAGNVVGQTTAWVIGGVPSGNRTFFRARVPQAASYRVTIQTFDWLDKNAPGS